MKIKKIIASLICIGLMLSGVSYAAHYHYKKKTVIWIQHELKTLGYYNGQTNGVLDKETTEAIKAFQKAHGLKADGIPGRRTRHAIKKAIKAEMKSKALTPKSLKKQNAPAVK